MYTSTLSRIVADFFSVEHARRAQLTFYDPSTGCYVDENGLIDLPDGTKAPYTAAADFIVGPDGYYQYVDGEF